MVVNGVVDGFAHRSPVAVASSGFAAPDSKAATAASEG
jgi:hypothetical protein